MSRLTCTTPEADWIRRRFSCGVDGEHRRAAFEDGSLWWPISTDLAPGPHRLELSASDRLGNESGLVWGFDLAERAVPGTFELGRNSPNPFNPSKTIPFSLPHGDRQGQPIKVTLNFFNTSGQLVRNLLASGRSMAAGAHQVSWDGRDAAGETVASGVYLYRLESEAVVKVKRMLLLK